MESNEVNKSESKEENKSIITRAIEDYQCPGCVVGSDTSCFEPSVSGVGCGKHTAGTNIFTTELKIIFLGMPVGFNRLGFFDRMIPYIFSSFKDCEWKYDMFNIPVWKYLNENGHTLVRGLMPRINTPFLHIYLEDCMESINCYEIKESDLEEMD